MTRNSNVTMSSRSQNRSTRHQKSTSAILSKISRGRTTQALKHNHTKFVCNALWVRKPMQIHQGGCNVIRSLQAKNQTSSRWGVVDWGGLGMWNVRMDMIGCRPVEMWWWRGWDVRVEGGRLGMNVWRRIWRSLVYMLNGQCSGICGEASYQGKRLTLAERGRNGRFKNKWWWWWWSVVTSGECTTYQWCHLVNVPHINGVIWRM